MSNWIYSPYVPLVVTRINLMVTISRSRVGQIWMLTNEMVPFIVVKSCIRPFRGARVYHNVESLDGKERRTPKEFLGVSLGWERSKNHRRIL